MVNATFTVSTANNERICAISPKWRVSLATPIAGLIGSKGDVCNKYFWSFVVLVGFEIYGPSTCTKGILRTGIVGQKGTTESTTKGTTVRF